MMVLSANRYNPHPGMEGNLAGEATWVCNKAGKRKCPRKSRRRFTDKSPQVPSRGIEVILLVFCLSLHSSLFHSLSC